MSTVRLVLPTIFISLGAFGIFAASGSAAILALFVSLYFLVKKFDYRPKLQVSKPVLKQVFHYSASSYIANILNILPTLLLPIIIINKLGAPSAAYYYLAFMIANLLYTVVYSVTQSMFAEGSYDDRNFKELVKKSVVLQVITVSIGSTILTIVAPLILRVFGSNYSLQAVSILRILAWSAPFVCLYVTTNILLRIKKQMRSIILIDIIYALCVCGLVLTWASRGLDWVGLAWLVGNALAGLMGLFLLLVNPRLSVAVD